MSELATTGTKAISTFLNQKNVLEKFANILGEKAQGFIASVITIVNSNSLLKNATQESVYSAALMAATLDLPLNNNLGFAYIVPFNNTKERKQEAQFQLGYKGYIQLAMRSGQFRTIAVTPIYDGQLVSENPLTGFEFDFKAKRSEEVVGYAAYFALINGFEKTLYMTKEEAERHGKQYSQTYKRGFGLWNDNFDSMAQKTVLKALLSKYAPMSVEMQKAVIADQAVIKNAETMEVDYVDNQSTSAEEYDHEEERKRLGEFIQNAKDTKALDAVKENAVALNMFDEFEARKNELVAS